MVLTVVLTVLYYGLFLCYAWAGMYHTWMRILEGQANCGEPVGWWGRAVARRRWYRILLIEKPIREDERIPVTTVERLRSDGWKRIRPWAIRFSPRFRAVRESLEHLRPMLIAHQDGRGRAMIPEEVDASGVTSMRGTGLFQSYNCGPVVYLDDRVPPWMIRPQVAFRLRHLPMVLLAGNLGVQLAFVIGIYQRHWAVDSLNRYYIVTGSWLVGYMIIAQVLRWWLAMNERMRQGSPWRVESAVAENMEPENSHPL